MANEFLVKSDAGHSFHIFSNITNLSFMADLHANLSRILINHFQRLSVCVERIRPVFREFLSIHNELLYWKQAIDAMNGQ